ncbi:hypothetical protein [Streptomyces chryseus]|uniref:Secreted protein n=1 Tax=Streptomyces chryseus TaxID=68186 RepID=A0ABQ3DZK0_9ACTN|nr:hypothetical protein [Streptomyces chryseus]GHB20040.1 hypothetical protein GCM10010346_49770 [Streptomyces chryseus]
MNKTPLNKNVTRRLVGTVLPAVLVVGALVGGAAYTANTVGSADVTAPTTVWKEPSGKPAKDPAGNVARGKDSTELSKLLLPVPETYRLGPDIGSYGNDSELSSAQAVALLKEQGRGIYGKKRREYEREVDKLGVRGIAVRSYTSNAGDLVIQTQIVRIKDRKQVYELHKFRMELLRFLGVPKGPKVEGHKKASCVMAAPTVGSGAAKKPELDGMFCMAYDRELMVNITASGTKPFSKSDVTRLVKDQLDHVVSPGEYI